MPKKQTSKKKLVKSTMPFAHPTRHGKLHWRKILFLTIIGSYLLVLTAAISVQYFYNLIVWSELSRNSIYRMSSLIIDSIDGLTEIKSSPDEANRIPEVRLQLSEPTENVKNILYTYEKQQPSPDPNNELYMPFPESLQITSKSITNYGKSKLIPGNSMEELFNNVPEAQACARGFTLQFEPISDYKDVNNFKLNDGRTLYLYREPACSSEEMSNLEAYLLQAQSY